MDCVEKVKNQISLALCHRFSSFFHHMIGKIMNYYILNKNYLDIIDRGHSKGNVFQICLHRGYPWTNFNKIATKMMASRFDNNKNVISFDLKIVGQGHYLQNCCISAII